MLRQSGVEQNENENATLEERGIISFVEREREREIERRSWKAALDERERERERKYKRTYG